MANLKITELTENTSPVSTDLMVMVDDPSGTPLTQKVTMNNLKKAITPTGVTYLTQPNWIPANTPLAPLTLNVNTTMNVGQFVLPYQITVNKISISVTTVTVAGTLDLTIFTEDGQTQSIAVTTASISGTGVNTTSVSAVVLNPGVYYFAVNPNDTADIAITAISQSTISNDLMSSVTSEPVVMGTVTITAGTPAAFTPSSVTTANTKLAYFRLDN